jgi:hypothetical protein
VKCNCGNPLTPPEPIAPTHTRGTAWPGYTATQVAVVRPGPATTTITLINTTTGDRYTQPTGASGGEFVAATEDSTATHTYIATSADGAAWKTVVTLDGRVHGLAWGDGKWLAARSSGNPVSPSTVLESTDLVTWHPVGTIPSVVNDIAYANGRWIAVGGVVTGTDELASEFPKGAVYSSTDGATWNRAAAVDRAPEFTSVAFGNDRWVASANGVHQGGEPSFVFVSSDATHWTSNGMLNGQNYNQLAFGAGRWVLGGAQLSGQSGVISLSRDATTWTQEGTFANNRITGVAYGAGRWIAVGPDGTFGASPSTSTAFASSDGKTWSRRGHLENIALDLAFGGDASSGSSGTVATPTSVAPSAQASSLENVKWKNYTYESQVCPQRGLVKFTNGTWYQPGTKGTFEECSMSLVAVDYADVTGDGHTDAIVSLHGSTSGVRLGQSDWTTVFTASPGGPVNHGYIYGPSFPPYSASAGITIWIPHPGPLDPGCCPTDYDKDVYKYSSAGGTFTKRGTTTVPASELPKR